MNQECEPRQSDSRIYVLIIYTEMSSIWASLMVQRVKNLPANARDEGDASFKELDMTEQLSMHTQKEIHTEVHYNQSVGR